MRTRAWRLLLVCATAALLLVPGTAFATESGNGRTIDFGTFLTEVAESGYSYDGQGVTVEWSPSSACTDNRGAGNHNCLFEGEAPQPDGNNAQRGQGNNAQYQIFSGQDDVTIANVNFKFVPADFTLCMNSGWAGAFTADVVKNAELQLLNTGDVTFSNCGFDGVIASPYASTTNSTFTGCNFSNVYNGYAIKDVRSASASISSCTFTNCGGGIYFEGASAKGAINITGNTFTDVDAYAAEDKKFTRGLIQFSAAGDYSNASIDISGNTSTGGAGAIRQLNKSLTAGVLELDAVLANNSFDGSELTDSSFGTNTVYYNGSYYPTLTAALTAVYTGSPAGTAKVYCKPGADVGTMTHGHVSDDLVIYGNDAYVSGGERDLEIDTYKYDRATGVQNANGAFLDRDITVTVKELDGIAAWGQRNTAHTVNLVFEDCQNMQRIYFTNSANKEGAINISLTGCSFDGSADAALRANPDTAVYSNAMGDISIKDTTFTQIAVGLNINHKSSGTQNITLENCLFEDCALADGEKADATKTYGAPVRVVAQEGAKTNLAVNGTRFVYSEGKQNIGNGDILIGDGRHDAKDEQGVVTLAMTNTDADVMVQEKGYYGADGNVADESKGAATSIDESEAVIPNDGSHFEVDKHDSFEIVGAKDATCTDEGYTGDKVCAKCGKLLESGTAIAKLPHNFVNGTCSVCGATDPGYVAPSDPSNPTDESGSKPLDTTGSGSLAKTSDGAGMLIGFAALIACAAGAVVAMAARVRKA